LRFKSKQYWISSWFWLVLINNGVITTYKYLLHPLYLFRLCRAGKNFLSSILRLTKNSSRWITIMYLTKAWWTLKLLLWLGGNYFRLDKCLIIPKTVILIFYYICTHAFTLKVHKFLSNLAHSSTLNKYRLECWSANIFTGIILLSIWNPYHCPVQSDCTNYTKKIFSFWTHDSIGVSNNLLFDIMSLEKRKYSSH
jgi:hypothetical protein